MLPLQAGVMDALWRLWIRFYVGGAGVRIPVYVSHRSGYRMCDETDCAKTQFSRMGG